jgi:predicted tellurium resistance membrane protein TerC
LVVIGLLISLPIVLFGSALVLRLVRRFPLVIQLGGAILAFTAAKMIVSEPLLKGVFGPFHGDITAAPLQTAARWVVYLAVIGGVMMAGWWKKRGAQVSQQLVG